MLNTAPAVFTPAQLLRSIAAIWAKMFSFKTDDPLASNCLNRVFIQHAGLVTSPKHGIVQVISTHRLICCLPVLSPAPVQFLPRSMRHSTLFTTANTAGAVRYIQCHIDKSPNEDSTSLPVTEVMSPPKKIKVANHPMCGPFSLCLYSFSLPAPEPLFLVCFSYQGHFSRLVFGCEIS